MKVEPIKPTGNIEEYISSLSSAVYGNNAVKNPKKRFIALLKESYGDMASRVLEYLPCKIPAAGICDIKEQLFGFQIRGTCNYYTNARELLHWGWTIEKVKKFIDFTHYRAFRCVAPRFVYNQVQTHTQITTVCFSARYSVNKLGYYKPKRVMVDNWGWYVQNTPPIALKQYLKQFSKRTEIYNRGADSLENVCFSLGGFLNNPNSFPHFINQRTHYKTQKETREFVKLFKKYL